MRRVYIVFLFNAIILTIDAFDIKLTNVTNPFSKGLDFCCNRIYVGHIVSPEISGIEKLLGYYKKANNIGLGHNLFNDRPVYFQEKTEGTYDVVMMWYCGQNWNIATLEDFGWCKGCCKGFAHAGQDNNDEMCPEDIRGFDWRVETDDLHDTEPHRTSGSAELTVANRTFDLILDTAICYCTGTWIDAKSLAVRCV